MNVMGQGGKQLTDVCPNAIICVSKQVPRRCANSPRRDTEGVTSMCFYSTTENKPRTILLRRKAEIDPATAQRPLFAHYYGARVTVRQQRAYRTVALW